jgi:hypothetical protein
MRHRTAAIVAALVLLLCARMPAWPGANAHGPSPGATPAPACGQVRLHTDWESASVLRRWLGLFMEREGS